VIAVPVRTEVLMGTIVTIHVVEETPGAHDAIERAFGWFRDIEARCTRFDAGSELMQLCAGAGEAVQVSPTVFEAVRFAIAVAADTGGAFDPVITKMGRDSGNISRGHRRGASYRDVEIDDDARTIALRRPLTIDLGAVAKGLAVDAAARELRSLRDFAIDAGGDLYLGGCNPDGAPWSVGIRHPRGDALLETIRVSDMAVCTSGDYERPGHIRDPRAGAAPDSVASVTVVAPGAMLADALGTAAFVLGPVEGLRLFERQGVEGLIVAASLERVETAGFPRS
jgi:FAD:protein FMN transferase